uniref:FHA domain-containing protein n=1 Tax=Globodera pallida TaxID=36090 RepID=A0A183C6Q3_GLOPA
MAAATSTTSGALPFCILTPCSNSHPFEERRVVVTRSEENAVKIGRSIIRLQPSASNAIFDCKVLSRNHAILWLNANGQFMVKDTRSSNGTFINNERLSASGEENEPREIFSGDILQLGVEIVDNAKKVASGCVTCIVRLINERGEECAERPKTEHGTVPLLLQQQIPHNYTLVRNDKLFILDQYIKEAKHRENLLGLKLQTLEEQLRTAQEALQTKWQEHVDQLESQLDIKTKWKGASRATAISAKNGGTDGTTAEQQRLVTEMRELAEDRGRIEQMAKESLRAMQEQVQESAMNLVNVEEECTFLRQRCTDFETQFGRQRDDFDALLRNYNELLGLKLQTLEEQLRTAQEALQTKLNGRALPGLLPFLQKMVALMGRTAEQQRLVTEMRELAEDRGRIEQMAKESLRAMQEQVQESAMKLHDSDMSLVNVEEECTFLRQRCTDFETQFGRQRDDFDALLRNYNEAYTAASAQFVHPAAAAAAMAPAHSNAQHQQHQMMVVPQQQHHHEQQQQEIAENAPVQLVVPPQQDHHEQQQQPMAENAPVQLVVPPQQHHHEQQQAMAENAPAQQRMGAAAFGDVVQADLLDNKSVGFALLAMVLYVCSPLERVFLVLAVVAFFWFVHRRQNQQQRDNAAAAAMANVGDGQPQQQQNAGVDDGGDVANGQSEAASAAAEEAALVEQRVEAVQASPPVAVEPSAWNVFFTVVQAFFTSLVPNPMPAPVDIN